jgi:hypothetical protein
MSELKHYRRPSTMTVLLILFISLNLLAAVQGLFFTGSLLIVFMDAAPAALKKLAFAFLGSDDKKLVEKAEQVEACAKAAWWISALMFACWTERIVNNAHSFRLGMRSSAIAAVLWHVVPIANLIFPYRILLEAWKSSGSSSDLKTPFSLVAWWAPLCVLRVVYLAEVLGLMAALGKSFPGPILLLSFAMQCLFIISGICLIIFALQFQARQEHTHKHLESRDTPSAPVDRPTVAGL